MGSRGTTVFDAAFRTDPYPTYARLRQAGPIHWSEELHGGAWLLTRHADVDVVLRDPVRFSARRTGGWVMQSRDARSEFQDFQKLFARSMLFLDAPDHTRIRAVLQAGFRHEFLHGFAPAIERRVDDLLDAVDVKDGFDFIETLARPLPAEVMAMLMGIPTDQRSNFVAWAEDLATFIGAQAPSMYMLRRARDSLLAMGTYFEQYVVSHQTCTAEGLVRRLLRAEAAGEIRCSAELLSQCAMLLFAGYETTRNLLGNGLQAVLTNSCAWQCLQREPGLWSGAVREMLRFDSPVQYTGRRVVSDVLLHGKTLKRGDLVIALIGSANRDPAHYANPDRFEVERRTSGPLSFGGGPHVCIGAGLALMEAEIVFGRLSRRFPNLRLVDAKPRWNGNTVYRGLSAMPVQCGGGLS